MWLRVYSLESEKDEPMLSQPAFGRKAPDRYVELLNFEMEVLNIFQAKAFDLNDEEKLPFIKNWLGREGLQFIQTSTNTEKEACKSVTGLFNVLKEKFMPHHNKMILSVQYCKLHKKENESTQKCMGRLCINTAECNYKEHDRHRWSKIYTTNHKRTNSPKNTREIVSGPKECWHRWCRKKCYMK